MNDNLAVTVNSTFYDIFILYFSLIYRCVCVFGLFFYYIYIYFISLPLAYLLGFLICFVSAYLNRVTWSHGAIEMPLLLYYYYYYKLTET